MFQSEEQRILLKDSARCVPRYLFRTFSDQSRGTNSATEAIPDASCYLTTITADEKLISSTKHMISDHLLYKYSTPSEFSSWSSSLLFVLRHAIRRAHQPSLQDTNVFICVLDTTTLPDDLQIYPATALMAAYDIKPIVVRPLARNDKRNWLVPHYYLGEYLLHGPLSLAASTCAAVKMQTVSLDCLEHTGLYCLLPALNNATSNSLAPEVRALRRALSGRDAKLEPLLPVHIGAFSTLGRLFGTSFALPVTMAFLTLRRWHTWPGQQVLDTILDSFEGYEGPNEAGPERLDWENGDGLAITDEVFVVSEARMLRRLMQDLVARKRHRDKEPKRAKNGFKMEILHDEIDSEDLSCLIGDIQLSSQESEAKTEPETSTGLDLQNGNQVQPDERSHSATEVSLSATLGALATSAASLDESFRNLVQALQPEVSDAAPPLPRDAVLKELEKSRDALKSLSEASGRLGGLLGQDEEEVPATLAGLRKDL